MANVKISDLGSIPSPLTGAEEIPLVQAGSTYKATPSDIATYVNSNSTYTVYTAILAQVGSLAPTENILNNTLGNIVWGRDDVGNYVANSSGLFTDNKTFVFATQADGNKSGIICGQVDSNTINLSTYNTTSLIPQDYNGNIQIEIRVYNSNII